MPRSGSCLCGAVRFTAAELGNLGVCHCRMCQRWAGGPFFGVTVKPWHMSVEGAETIGTFMSSAWASRCHCKTCGSTVWYRYDPKGDGGGSYEVPIGILDDADGLILHQEIYIDRKPDCFDIAGDHPRRAGSEVEHLFSGTQQGA